jgi:hypothetical protein
MLQAGGELDLLKEAIDPGAAAHLGANDLDGDMPLVAQIAGEKYRRHSAGADLALDGIAVLELHDQAIEAIGHG